MLAVRSERTVKNLRFFQVFSQSGRNLVNLASGLRAKVVISLEDGANPRPEASGLRAKVVISLEDGANLRPEASGPRA